MAKYADGYAFPIATEHLYQYQKVAREVAAIWREHGALEYYEFYGDDLHVPGTRSFIDAVGAKADETVVFGWALFESKKAREQANAAVRKDPRMGQLVGPLMDPNNLIFDAQRMIFGGFDTLV